MASIKQRADWWLISAQRAQFISARKDVRIVMAHRAGTKRTRATIVGSKRRKMSTKAIVSPRLRFKKPSSNAVICETNSKMKSSYENWWAKATEKAKQLTNGPYLPVEKTTALEKRRQRAQRQRITWTSSRQQPPISPVRESQKNVPRKQ